MFYRVGKAREKQKARKRQTKAAPNFPPPISTHHRRPSFFFLFLSPIQKSCQSLSYPVIPSFSFPNQPSRSSLSYPVILSFSSPHTKNPVNPSLILSSCLFSSPKRKSRQSCLHPAILSKIIPSILSKNSIQKPKHPKRDLSIVSIFQIVRSDIGVRDSLNLCS